MLFQGRLWFILEQSCIFVSNDPKITGATKPVSYYLSQLQGDRHLCWSKRSHSGMMKNDHSMIWSARGSTNHMKILQDIVWFCRSTIYQNVVNIQMKILCKILVVLFRGCFQYVLEQKCIFIGSSNNVVSFLRVTGTLKGDISFIKQSFIIFWRTHCFLFFSQNNVNYMMLKTITCNFIVLLFQDKIKYVIEQYCCFAGEPFKAPSFLRIVGPHKEAILSIKLKMFMKFVMLVIQPTLKFDFLFYFV